MSNNSKIFKEHILQGKRYVGGVSRGEAKDNSAQDDLIKLSSNENVLGPSPKAIEALRSAINVIHEYPDQDDTKLRYAAVDFFEQKLSEDQFFFVNSGMEVLDIICRAFLSPGLNCILSNPTFPPYKNLANIQGAEVIDVPLLPDDFDLDVEGILEKIDHNTRLIFLTNPNNPTGTALAKEKVDLLISKVPDHVVVVFDEAYYHFVESEDFPFGFNYLDSGKNIVILHSFSKIFGLAGLRLGYVVSTPEITGYLRQLTRPFMINSLTMKGALAAIADTNHLEKTKRMVREGRNWLYGELDQLKLKYWKSYANFVLIRLPVSSKEVVRLLLTHNIMVRPADNFGAPDCIRVTIGTDEMNKAFVKALKTVLQEFDA